MRAAVAVQIQAERRKFTMECSMEEIMKKDDAV
jgi:hypothetical protein